MKLDLLSILNRLEFITEQIKILEEFDSLTYEFYLNNRKIQLITERLLELIIQTSLDINEHILTKGYQIKFTTNKESFLKMAQLNIISFDLAKELSLSAGMRNILAHQYLDIEPKFIFESINKALKKYPIYIKEIQEYIKSLD